MNETPYFDQAMQKDFEEMQQQMQILTNRLDDLQQERLFDHENRSRFRTTQCYNCGAFGHIASKCDRNRPYNKYYRQSQLN